ncbi:mCG144681, partial [Mus musculus]
GPSAASESMRRQTLHLACIHPQVYGSHLEAASQFSCHVSLFRMFLPLNPSLASSKR